MLAPQCGGDFSPWFYCLAVVSFHISKGHVIDSVHPKADVFISEEEAKTIGHFSLPDTTIDIEGDIMYTFRYRLEGDKFTYGSVYFRQIKDSSMTRGYLQKSLVAVCRSPELLTVTSELVKALAPLYFSFGAEVLEAACNECRLWPVPDVKPIILNVAGTQIWSESSPSLALFQDVPLFSTFGSLSVALWLLWELVLTGQPILVLGPSPDRCSRAVLGLCSLIAPIPVSVDYRPFFTMFDRDFNMVSKNGSQTPVIIGGTNPFLLRSLEHFPNVVSLGSSRASTEDTQVARRNQTLRSLLRNRRWEKSLVLTREEPLVLKDEKLILALRRIGPDPKVTISENNDKLRKAFTDMTRKFLEPLETFVRLKPFGERAKGGIRVSAYHDEVLLEENLFSKESFMAFVSAQRNTKDKQFPPMLYRKFLDGPNFPAWLDGELKRSSWERLEIRRTLIVETDAKQLLAVSKPKGESMTSRVFGALQNELAKPNCDVELCERMAEHLKVLTSETAQ